MSVWVYFETNKRNGTIYTGVTNDLVRRAHEHREGLVGGFTKRYGLKRLVWFEGHDTMPLAIQREKSLKRYDRAWKVALIEAVNPAWDDLWFTIIK